MRDCSFLKPVSLRPIRWPAARPTRPPPLSTAEIRSGRNAGLFCPSPSSVATMAPRAARTPLRTAADCPPELACSDCRKLSMLLHHRREPLGGRIGRAVIDIDDFMDPAALERGDDFRDQRRDIVRFVAYRNNDGNGDRLLGRKWSNRNSVWLVLKGRNRSPRFAFAATAFMGRRPAGNPFEALGAMAQQGPQWCRRHEW